MLNQTLATHAIEELIAAGVQEWIVCPGARNAPLVQLLLQAQLKTHFWPEERSAAFFALGRSRRLQKPVAVIVTSGTAAGELLPALMEAYYSCIPLVAVTADRPKRMRHTGAPQTAEQNQLYGVYTPISYDLEDGERCHLADWDQKSPLHLNLCFEEPKPTCNGTIEIPKKLYNPPQKKNPSIEPLEQFLKRARKPLVIVAGLDPQERKAVYRFLIEMQAPVYLEAPSGLRGEPKLQPFRVYLPDLKDYDAVLRIGKVPTHRIWRDLEERKALVEMLSLSAQPFAGLSWAPHLQVDLSSYLEELEGPIREYRFPELFWERQRSYKEGVLNLMAEEPLSEASLVGELSKVLPVHTDLFLGNSLPIRSWDLAAADNSQGLDVIAVRGLNGIDGQIATFLGHAVKERFQAALIGDLTALYDFAGLWASQELSDLDFSLFVINNGGGKIFSGMFPEKEIQHPHQLSFRPFTDFWGLQYERLEQIPEKLAPSGKRLVEIIPDLSASERFRQKLKALSQEICAVR